MFTLNSEHCLRKTKLQIFQGFLEKSTPCPFGLSAVFYTFSTYNFTTDLTGRDTCDTFLYCFASRWNECTLYRMYKQRGVIEMKLSKRVRYDICIQFHGHLDIITDAIPNVTLFYIERRTVPLTNTVVEINWRKKGSTDNLPFSELGTTQDIKEEENDKKGCFSFKIKPYLGQSVFRRVVTISTSFVHNKTWKLKRMNFSYTRTSVT